MILPEISNVAEALELIDLVSTDPRIAELLGIFSANGDLSRVISFLGQRIPDLDESEREHATLIQQAWRHLQDCHRTIPDGDSCVERLKHQASAWDLRIGRERDAIPVSLDILPPDVVMLIDEIADDWGMRDRDPGMVSGEFDAVVAIGGMVRANLARPATLSSLLAASRISAGSIVGLAAQRQITDLERKISAEMGLHVNTEQDALRLGFERAFNLDPDAWHTVGRQEILMNAFGTEPVLFGETPPNLLTGRRADTGQVFHWLFRQLDLPPNASILQLTTSINWIAHQIALRINSPRPIRPATIGHWEHLHPGPPHIFRSQHYLQEIKAVIDSLPQLDRWAQHPAATVPATTCPAT